MISDCLASIYANPPEHEMEVIVVDNVSVDGAVNMIRAEFPQVKLIQNSERHGFGHNQNVAIKAAQGEYVFVYNDDTLVHGKALQKLCDFLDQNPSVGVVGPRLLNPDGSLQKSCYKFPSPMRCISENLLLTAAFPQSTAFGDYRAWQHDAVREVDFVIGAAMLVRREVINQVGDFDDLFFMYSEETDWQMRIKKAGWKIMFNPDAQITHIGGQSSEDAPDKQFSEFQSSSAKLIRKHYGALGAAVQQVAMVFGAILRLAIWSCVAVIFKSKRAVANRKIQNWKKLLKWWLGLGPKQGLSESSS